MAHLQGTASDEAAADFLVRTLNAAPGEITILALAACTNIARAMQKDASIASKWQQLVILGGAFQVPGNVSPAAEANIMGDPEAADWVVSHGENVWMLGLDVTHSCSLSGEQLRSLDGVPLFCATFTLAVTNAIHRCSGAHVYTCAVRVGKHACTSVGAHT